VAEVRIRLAGNELEAQQLCAMLKLEGIPCYYRGFNTIPESAIGMNGTCEIVVFSEDAARARELIDAAR
jgi:hypothetical protein